MIERTYLEDLQLKAVATRPADQKPSFDWRQVVAKVDRHMAAPVYVVMGSERRDFDLAEVAETVGSALTDLLLSRHLDEEAIFCEENRRLVAAVARTVAQELLRRSDGAGGAQTLTPGEIYQIIEKALVRQNRHDVARSLVYQRQNEGIGRRPLGTAIQGMKTQVIRRNGQATAWDEAKIETAVGKAFLSCELDPSPAASVAAGVTSRVLTEGQQYLHIEDLQDMVQEEIMRQGHYKVAAAYIVYREHRAEQRREEQSAVESATDPDQAAMILVQREDSSTVLWDGSELKRRIEFACLGLELNLSPADIERELRRSVHPEMTEEGLKKTIILNAKSLIERDADFSRFAGRILLSYIYEEVTGWDISRDGIEAIPAFHRRAFKRNLARGVEIGRIDERMLDLDLDRLAEALDPAADLDFDYLGIQTLYDRYLIVDKKLSPPRRLEAPQLFWMRVAMGIFRGDDDPTEKIIALYRLYRGRRFCSSTPTLFNSGTNHSQLSSCYLYKVDDSIESIMQRGIAENAYLSKWAGGLGGSWTAVRGTGSHIHGTNGESQGVIPFLKLHNDQLCAVNQGGKRKGSGCAYLETWHNDIFDFLELRKNTGDDRRRTHDLNTANWIPDLFMKRMEERGHWTLFRANETEDLHELYGRAFEERYLAYEAAAESGQIWGERVEALALWKEMLKALFETGHPWITFKDPCNLRSPQDHVGVIHSSNLCTEITLNTSDDETAVCNLGSVVLDNHLTEAGEIDHELLRETVRIAVRALDRVIDINFYPTEAAERANRRHRPIGLGVMGLQNALFLRGQAFGSEEAVEFNDEFMEAIAFYAYEASSDLAEELGRYSSYAGSKWDRGLMPQDTIDLLEQERGQSVDVPRGGRLDWAPLREKIASQGMRNSNVLAIAPTATISNIMGSSPCIEPTYKNLFVKSNLSGDFVVLNPYLVRELRERGLWDSDMAKALKRHDGELAPIHGIPDDIKERHRTAFHVPFEFLLRAAARRQKWIDQSQSLNLFLAEPQLKTLSHMYRAAWRMGLKTTYYLRSLQASEIEKSTLDDVRVAVPVPQAAEVPVQSEAARSACRLDAMMNGEECESCQ